MSERKLMRISPTTHLMEPYKRVGIYCRVSTTNAAHLDSILEQVSYLTQLVASRNDWMLRDTYLDFDSGSRSSTRKSFTRMLNDCKNDRLDIIVTRTISRFGRNTIETLEQLRSLKECGVEVRFVQEELSSNDPEHELMISIISGLAQADNESRKENTMWGIQRKLEDGTSSIYSRPCYGYTKNKHGELVVEEKQAENVRLIFDLYLSGQSILGIIKKLSNRKISSPKGKDKWCKHSIELMLENEKYCGDVLVVKTYATPFPEMKRKTNRGERRQYYAVGSHPAIISKEIFEAVLEERKRRSNVEIIDGKKTRKTSKYSSKNNDFH